MKQSCCLVWMCGVQCSTARAQAEVDAEVLNRSAAVPQCVKVTQFVTHIALLTMASAYRGNDTLAGLGGSSTHDSTHGASGVAPGAEREAVSDSAELEVNNQHACPFSAGDTAVVAGDGLTGLPLPHSTSQGYQEPNNATATSDERDATAATITALEQSARSKPSSSAPATKACAAKTTFTAGAGARHTPQFESWVRELVEDFNELQSASSGLVDAVADAHAVFGLPFDGSGLSGALTLAQVAPLECPGERSGDTSQVHGATCTVSANYHSTVRNLTLPYFYVCCHRLLACRAVAAQEMEDARVSVDRAQARYGQARANLVVMAHAAVLHSDVLAAQKGKTVEPAKTALVTLEQCKALIEEDKAPRVLPADWDLCM